MGLEKPAARSNTARVGGNNVAVWESWTALEEGEPRGRRSDEAIQSHLNCVEVT